MIEFLESRGGTLGTAASATNLTVDIVRTGNALQLAALDETGAALPDTTFGDPIVPETAETIDVTAAFGGSAISRLTITAPDGVAATVSALSYDHSCL